MEYFIKNGCFPSPVIPLPRKNFNAITFAIYNVLVGLFITVLLNHCIQLYGLLPVVMFVVVIGVLGTKFITIVNCRYLELSRDQQICSRHREFDLSSIRDIEIRLYNLMDISYQL